jgi:hypothetical protein
MLVSALLQLLSLWLLSMAMNKHFRHAFSKSLTPRLEHLLSLTGWGFLGVSLFLVCQLAPWPLMMVYWVSYLALNITFIALLNSYQGNKRQRV